MGLEALLTEVQSVLQPAESRATFDDWLDRANPRLSWQVALGRARSQMITREQVDRARPIRAAFRRRLADLLAPDSVLAMPTTPFPAPPQGLRRSAMAPLRARCMMLTCVAGLSGVPQVSLPLGLVDGMPVGLSFLAAPGREDLLLHLVQALGSTAEPPR
jgi:amidase